MQGFTKNFKALLCNGRELLKGAVYLKIGQTSIFRFKFLNESFMFICEYFDTHFYTYGKYITIYCNFF